MQCVSSRSYDLGGSVFFDDADGPLAEELGGILSLVVVSNGLSFPQVQGTATQVQSRYGVTAGVSIIILAARQVA